MINMNTVEVKGNLIKNLVLLLPEDNDNDGTNGIEYLWQSAKEYFRIEESETNSEKYNNENYLIQKFEKQLKNNKPEVSVCYDFFNEYFSNDDYYKDYSVNIIEDENGKVKVISLAYLTQE